MDYIVVSGARPYDGRYELDVENVGITTLEWGWFKRLSGYFPLTIAEGYRNLDPELLTVFALVAMVRNGKIEESEVPTVFEKFQRLPFDTTIRMEIGEPEGDDASPPAPSGISNGSTSGDDSKTSSAKSESLQVPIGTPDLVTSESDRVTLPG